MVSLLQKITELTAVRDKVLLIPIIKDIERQSIENASITIFDDHVLIFSEKIVNGHQQIKTTFVKGNFKQLPKQEIIY